MRSGLPRLSGPWVFMLWFSALLLLMPFSASAAGFYDQPPMTEAEVTRFIADLPTFRSWARTAGESPHPSVAQDGLPGFSFSGRAADKARELGWKPERFFCVMGRSAAALALLERGDPGTGRPSDMPMVSPAELRLVRRHLEAFVGAGQAR